ncbi:hypothetical protein NDU88_001382 [Pleurodeles waltl]|uniref:Uncharacterized protein n=1 Tax=Pleurodeles waltl TaxID=8319 RepID=A0AAV7USL8_PLEWA|nr:hypothetical protein NDU88_001382 [Pleurodeles waltl]
MQVSVCVSADVVTDVPRPRVVRQNEEGGVVPKVLGVFSPWCRNAATAALLCLPAAGPGDSPETAASLPGAGPVSCPDLRV